MLLCRTLFNSATIATKKYLNEIILDIRIIPKKIRPTGNKARFISTIPVTLENSVHQCGHHLIYTDIIILNCSNGSYI